MARVRIPSVPANLGEAGRIQLTGMREYAQKLQQLGDGMVTRGCVTALGAGVNVLRDAVRARAPVLQAPDPRRRVGVLRNAVQALRSKLTRFAVTYVVGVRQLKGAQVKAFTKRTGRRSSENPDDPFYGSILEYGKTARTQRPFIRPAFDAAAAQAVTVSFNRLATYTEAEIRRLASR